MEACTEVVIKIHENDEDESMSSPLSSPSDSEETEDSDSVTVIPVPKQIPVPVPTIEIIHIDIGSNEDNSSYSGASIEECVPKGIGPSQTHDDDKIQGVEKNNVDRDHCYSRGSTSKIEERKGSTNKGRDDSGGIKIKDEGKHDRKDCDLDRDRKRKLDRDLHRGQGSDISGGIKIKDEEKKERKDRDRHRNRSRDRDRGDSESIKIKEEKTKERRKQNSPGVMSKDKDNVDAFGRTKIRDQVYSQGRRSSPAPTYSSTAGSGRRRKESRSPDHHRRINRDRGRSRSRGKILRRRSKSPSTSRSICSINRDRRSRYDNQRSRSRSGSPSHRHRRYLRQRSRSRSRSQSQSRSSPKEYDYYRNRRIYRSKSRSRTRSPPKHHKIKKEIKPYDDFASMKNRKEQEKRQSINENSASLSNSTSTSFLEASFVRTKQEKINSSNHNTENIMIFYEKLQAQAKGKWTEELEIRWHLRLVEEAKLTAGRSTDTLGKIPEDHPLYASEWEKFWKCRYQQVQDIQMNAKTHDFTSEWKIYWDTLSADVSHRHQSQQRQPTTSTTVSDAINYNGPPASASASATIMSVPPTFIRPLRHEPFSTGNFVPGHALDQNQFPVMMSVPVPVPMPTPTPEQQLPSSFHDYGHGSGSCAGVDFDVKAAYPSSSYSTSTQPPVSVAMDNDECNVVRELRRMLDLKDELSFLSRQVQHYYIQAQQMDMMQSRGSLAMLGNTEFVHLLFKCRDKFFAVLQANVCSRDEMKKINLAVFGLNNLLNSPLCENIRPPAPSPSPVPAAVPDLAFAPAPLPSSAEGSRPHQAADIYQPLQNNYNSFPQAALPTQVLATGFKAEGSTSTSLSVKTEVVDSGSLCIDTDAESKSKLLLDNPIPSALKNISDSAKIELSTIIAGALIAQGKERDKKRNRMKMRAGDLLPKLLSIFAPVLSSRDGGGGGNALGHLKVEVPTGSGAGTGPDSAFAYDRIPKRDRVASIPMSMSMSTSNQSFIESETRPTIATPPITTTTLAHSPPEAKPKVPLKPFMLISAKANEIHPIPPIVEITARAASPPLPGTFKHAKKYPKPLAFISSKASEISAIPPLPEYTARAASPPSEKEMLKKFLRKRQHAESDPRRGGKWGKQSPSFRQDNSDNSNINRDRDVQSRERSSRRSISVSKHSRNSRSLSPSLLEPAPTYDIKDEDLIDMRRGSPTDRDQDRDQDRDVRRQEHERENVKHEREERHCSSGSIDNPITIGDRARNLCSEKHVKIPGAPKIWMPPSDLSTVSSESSFEFMPGSHNGDRDRGPRPMYRENKENGGQRHFDTASMNKVDPRRPSSTRGDIRILRNPHFVKSEKIKTEKPPKSKNRKSENANSKRKTNKVKVDNDQGAGDGDNEGGVKEEGETVDPDMEDGEILSDSETDFSDDNSEVCPMTPPRPVSVLSYASDVSEDWEKGIFFYPR